MKTLYCTNLFSGTACPNVGLGDKFTLMGLSDAKHEKTGQIFAVSYNTQSNHYVIKDPKQTNQIVCCLVDITDEAFLENNDVYFNAVLFERNKEHEIMLLPVDDNPDAKFVVEAYDLMNNNAFVGSELFNDFESALNKAVNYF